MTNQLLEVPPLSNELNKNTFIPKDNNESFTTRYNDEQFEYAKNEMLNIREIQNTIKRMKLPGLPEKIQLYKKNSKSNKNPKNKKKITIKNSNERLPYVINTPKTSASIIKNNPNAGSVKKSNQIRRQRPKYDVDWMVGKMKLKLNHNLLSSISSTQHESREAAKFIVLSNFGSKDQMYEQRITPKKRMLSVTKFKNMDAAYFCYSPLPTPNSSLKKQYVRTFSASSKGILCNNF